MEYILLGLEMLFNIVIYTVSAILAAYGLWLIVTALDGLFDDKE